MHFVLKGIIILIFFISWKIFAACSPYSGDATINEIYKAGGQNGDSFIEFNLLDNSIPSSVYKQWSIKICYEIEIGKGKNKSKSNICDVIPVSEMDDATQWIWVSNPRVDRDYLDFNNGFDLSLLDNNDNFIDYIQVEGYSGQNFTSSCSYSGLNYVFNIPNSINGGTKILLRKPDGTGEWIEDKNTNTYPTSRGGTNNGITVLDHYEIIHDGQGLTCDAETITIKACTNESCSTESTESISLDLLGNGTLKSSVTFTGTTTVNVNHTAVGTLTFSLNNETIAPDNLLICDDGSSDNCDMTFTTAGFRFFSGAGSSTTIPNQTAGAVFSDSLKLQAVKDTNGVCTGIFDGNTAVDLSQENVNPGGTNGLNFSVGGNPIAKYSSTTSTTLSFGTNSIATLSSPIYHDAGQIRLHANYSVGGVTLTGSSNAFWVSPAELVISATSGATNLIGATATATPTHAAGEDFTLSVSAYNAATPAVITPNYSPGQIEFKLARTGPTLTDSVDGNLNYAAASTLTTSTTPEFEDITLTSFVSGESIYNAAHYSEVGLINLEVQDNEYGGGNIIIAATAINIGRFIPDHFKQTIVNSGSFFSTCNTGTTFAYSGQKDEATDSIGAISYPISPVLLITAYNKQGDITRNYYEDSQGSTNDYMKLSAAGVSVSVPTTDQVKTGVNGDKLPLTANMNTGTLSQNDLTTSIPSDNPLAKGELHYQFSDDDHFFYNRSANAVVTPFTSDITFSIATIIDADNVNVTTTEVASPTGIEIRFGRLVLKNSFGPETSNLPQQMQIEHFDGTDFVVSSDNDCVGYDASKISLTNVSLDPAITDKLGGTGNFIEGKTQAIELEATGDGNRGSIGVSYDIYDWLKYDWSGNDIYDEDPSAVATFGLYRGNDRIIYTREIF